MSELAELAKAEGVELSDEQLENPSGGNALLDWANECPKKDCTDYTYHDSCPPYKRREEPTVL